MEEKNWQVIDNNNTVLGEYPTYFEALEVATTLEYYGLRCNIKNKKENV